MESSRHINPNDVKAYPLWLKEELLKGKFMYQRLEQFIYSSLSTFPNAVENRDRFILAVGYISPTDILLDVPAGNEIRLVRTKLRQKLPQPMVYITTGHLDRPHLSHDDGLALAIHAIDGQQMEHPLRDSRGIILLPNGLPILPNSTFYQGGEKLHPGIIASITHMLYSRFELVQKMIDEERLFPNSNLPNDRLLHPFTPPNFHRN